MAKSPTTKRKRKSNLQKRIDNPNSRLWRNKADKLWRQLVLARWGGRCAVCGVMEHVQAHHLIPKEMHSHRHLVENGILLCALHHKYSFELSPHKSPIIFVRWLIVEYPAVWDWLLKQSPTNKNVTPYKQAVDALYLALDSDER